jgi:hypothetical protein
LCLKIIVRARIRRKAIRQPHPAIEGAHLYVSIRKRVLWEAVRPRSRRHPAAKDERQRQEQMQRQKQQPQQPQAPQFVGTADLAARWAYTQQGINKLARTEDFPQPAFTLNAGRVRAWFLSAIEAFEKHHPELSSANEKKRKIYGYYRAVHKGRQQEEAPTP